MKQNHKYVGLDVHKERNEVAIADSRDQHMHQREPSAALAVRVALGQFRAQLNDARGL